MTACLWCNGPESCKRYHPGKDVDFICSHCVQKLLGFSQEDLVRGYRLAKQKGFESKMSALWSFMNDESRREIIRDGRSDIEKRLAGERAVRPVRHEQNQVAGLRKKGLRFIKLNDRSRLYFEHDLVEYFKTKRMVMNSDA